MKLFAQRAIQAAVILAIASLVGYGAVWVTVRTGNLKGAINYVGYLSAVFTIGDIFFWRLINKLEALRLDKSLSGWQVDEFERELRPFMRGLWFAFYVSIVVKVLALSPLLFFDSIPETYKLTVIFAAYFLIGIGLLYFLVNLRLYRQADRSTIRVVDACRLEKERRRLRGNLNSGEDFDIENDQVAKSYTSPSRPL